MNRFTAMAAGAAMLAASAGTASAQSGEITLVAYSGIFQDNYVASVVQPFMRRFPNVKVNYFAAGTSARPASSEVEIVAVDVPVRCGGAYLRPGDLITGDRDGIAVAPHEAIEALVAECEDLLLLEKEQELAIRDGASAAAIAAISRRKKQRKGPPFSPVAAGG